MLEVADIFRAAGGAYRAKFGPLMLPSHFKVMADIERCRTAALGGHLRECDQCGEQLYSYHSCRNRHCPKCGGDRSRRWLDRQRSRLLPCPYFLLTFTLPEELRDIARSHQRQVYGLLMAAAGQALKLLAADPRYLGAQPGIIGVLHTWTRDLLYHPHVHLLCTAGGLTESGEWRATRNPSFLVPCRALSVIFRAKIRDGLAELGLAAGLPRKLWRRKWVVHCQHAGTGVHVLDYLGRYLYRVAIANSRLEAFEDGRVTFRYRDGRTGETRHCTLGAEHFIARFLQHVLPRGLCKVRAWGLYSSRARNALERARLLLSGSTGGASERPSDPPPESESFSDTEGPARETDPRCPRCKTGRLKIVRELPRVRNLLSSLPPSHARAPP